jgi:predicted aconitase
VLAVPNGRGSCTGSQVILELILNGIAPAAMLLRQPDAILSLGVIVAEELFGKSIPILNLGEEGFAAVAKHAHAKVQGTVVLVGADATEVAALEAARGAAMPAPATPDDLLAASRLRLTDEERDMLSGGGGKAAAVAMRILARAAAIDGAPNLLPITQAHIDGCTYIGPGGLRFAQTLASLGGRVAVPTTLNSNSVDRRRWQALGVSPSLGEPAFALGDAYLAMGCSDRSFTCAPYLLESAPGLGEQIAWGESNAVVFANSVLGARTQKYADYLDICMAITGRAPNAGPHLDEHRVATAVLDAGPLAAALGDTCADAFFPALGYLCGLRSEARVPVVVGLEDRAVSRDELKAFSAAFGSTASVAMFHMAGHTPEAMPDKEAALGGRKPAVTIELTPADLAAAWRALDSGRATTASADAADPVQLVALGNPHLSLSECETLARLCANSTAPLHPSVSMVATMGRQVYDEAKEAGHISVLEDFGVQFVNDTCWCMLTEPVVPVGSEALITNSAKYAHYAPGLVSDPCQMAKERALLLALALDSALWCCHHINHITAIV